MVGKNSYLSKKNYSLEEYENMNMDFDLII